MAERENSPEAVFKKAQSTARGDAEAGVALYQAVIGMKDASGRRHPLAKQAAYAIAELYASQRKIEYDPRKASQVRSPTNWDLAARYFYAAFKLDPTKASDGMYRAGQIYLKLGQRKKARVYFERSAEYCTDPGVKKNSLRAASRIID